MIQPTPQANPGNPWAPLGWAWSLATLPSWGKTACVAAIKLGVAKTACSNQSIQWMGASPPLALQPASIDHPDTAALTLSHSPDHLEAAPLTLCHTANPQASEQPLCAVGQASSVTPPTEPRLSAGPSTPPPSHRPPRPGKLPSSPPRNATPPSTQPPSHPSSPTPSPSLPLPHLESSTTTTTKQTHSHTSSATSCNPSPLPAVTPNTLPTPSLTTSPLHPPPPPTSQATLAHPPTKPNNSLPPPPPTAYPLLPSPHSSLLSSPLPPPPKPHKRTPLTPSTPSPRGGAAPKAFNGVQCERDLDVDQEWLNGGAFGDLLTTVIEGGLDLGLFDDESDDEEGAEWGVELGLFDEGSEGGSEVDEGADGGSLVNEGVEEDVVDGALFEFPGFPGVPGSSECPASPRLLASPMITGFSEQPASPRRQEPASPRFPEPTAPVSPGSPEPTAPASPGLPRAPAFPGVLGGGGMEEEEDEDDFLLCREYILPGAKSTRPAKVVGSPAALRERQQERSLERQEERQEERLAALSGHTLSPLSPLSPPKGSLSPAEALTKLGPLLNELTTIISALDLAAPTTFPTTNMVCPTASPAAPGCHTSSDLTQLKCQLSTLHQQNLRVQAQLCSLFSQASQANQPCTRQACGSTAHGNEACGGPACGAAAFDVESQMSHAHWTCGHRVFVHCACGGKAGSTTLAESTHSSSASTAESSPDSSPESPTSSNSLTCQVLNSPEGKPHSLFTVPSVSVHLSHAPAPLKTITSPQSPSVGPHTPRQDCFERRPTSRSASPSSPCSPTPRFGFRAAGSWPSAAVQFSDASESGSNSSCSDLSSDSGDSGCSDYLLSGCSSASDSGCSDSDSESVACGTAATRAAGGIAVVGVQALASLKAGYEEMTTVSVKELLALKADHEDLLEALGVTGQQVERLKGELCKRGVPEEAVEGMLEEVEMGEAGEVEEAEGWCGYL